MASTELAKAYVQVIPSAQGISGSLTTLFASEATTAGLTTGTTIGTGLVSNLKGVLLGGGIAAAATLIVKGLKACVDESMQFDSAMSQLAATMGTTTDSIEELTDFAKQMGRTTAFSATEAAEGLNTLALAGLNADEQIEVLPTVLNLASAGALSLDDAAAYVTGTIKGFSASMSDAEHYADLMAKGATLANTDVNDLGEAMSSAAATANSYGQEAESVTLSLLRLAEQNVTGSEAATALNRAMADLYTPTAAAKSALDELGISVYDQSGTARDFNDVVDELSFALSGMSDEEANAYKDTIFTTRGLQAFNKMTVSSTDTVEEFKNELADCSGSAMQQAETQLDNLEGDITLFQSAMSGAKIAIGEALTPMLRGITEFATGAVNEFTDVITGEKSIGDVFSDVCDWIGEKVSGTDWEGMGTTIKEGIGNGVHMLVEDVPQKLAEFPGKVQSFLDETDWHEVGYNLVKKVLEGIGSIVTNIGSVIGEITSTIWEALEEVDWHNVGYNIMTFVLEGIKTIVVDVPQAIWEFVQAVWDYITEIDWLELGANIVEGIINGIVNFIPSIGGKIKEFGGGVIDAFKDFFGIGSPSKVMMEYGEYVAEGFVEGMKDMPSEVDSTLSETLNNVVAFGEDATSSMSSAASDVVSNVSSNYSNIPEKVNTPLGSALKNVVSWGKDTLSNVKSAASDTLANIKSNFDQAPDTVEHPLSNALSNITGWGKSSKAEASDTSSIFISNVKNGLSSLASTVKTPMTSAFNDTSAWGTDMVKEGLSSGQEFVTKMKSGLANLVSGVSGHLDSVTSYSTSWGSVLSSSFNSMGVNVMTGLQNGIGLMVSSLYTSIKNSLSGLVTKAKNALGIGSPSKVFRDEVGAMIGEGLALGIEDSVDNVEGSMDDLMDATDVTPFTGTFFPASFSGSGNSRTINVTQNIYSQAKSAAQLMRECRREAERAVMQGV